MRRFFLSFLVLLLIGPSFAGAKLYKYTDAEGIVSFADNLDKVPLAYREMVEIIEEADLPPLPNVPFPVSSAAVQRPFSQWLGRPNVGYITALSVILVMMALFAWKGVGGLFLKLATKLVFIVLLGAMIYNFALAKASPPDTPLPEGPVPFLSRGISTLQKAKEAAAAFEEKQRNRQEFLDSIPQTGE